MKYDKIKYDKQYKKVMKVLRTEFGWKDIYTIAPNYKDLANDIIRATRIVNKIDLNPPVSKSVCTCKHFSSSYVQICNKCF